MSDTRPSIDAWIDEIKSQPGSENIGIVFVQVGVARGSTRAGDPVAKIEMTHDPERLSQAVADAVAAPGVVAVRAWANRGTLEVGDDMLCAVVAGKIRPDTLAAWEELTHRLKSDVITYQEHYPDR